jgi:2-oxo-3-hexenedioate decarboxylase
VLTGSLVTTRFPQQSETYLYKLAGVGTVDLSVTM